MTRLKRIKRRVLIKLVNTFFSGTRTCFFSVKRYLLREAGFEIGDGTNIVGPVEISGNLVVGKNCWIGKNMKVNGNGTVIICDNCDVAPEVTFQTGGHQIGEERRRAGKGENYTQLVGSCDNSWQHTNRQWLRDCRMCLRCQRYSGQHTCRWGSCKNNSRLR